MITPHRTPEIEAIIAKLFWSSSAAGRQALSAEAIVEQTLNYGNLQDIKALFRWLGIERTAEIFSQTANRPRNNYHRRTRRYFTLFFNRHVPHRS